MNPETEAEMTLGIAVKPKLIGVLKHRRIPVGRTDQQKHTLSFLDLSSVPVEGSPRCDPTDLDRTVIAHQLFHCRWQKLWLRGNQAAGLRVLQQGQQRVTNLIRGGLVAIDQQKQCGGQQLSTVQLVPMKPRVGEGRQQTIARVRLQVRQ